MANSVKKLGSQAFEKCYSLKNLSISKGLKTIPYRCFDNCVSLERVVIPSNITKIEKE